MNKPTIVFTSSSSEELKEMGVWLRANVVEGQWYILQIDRTRVKLMLLREDDAIAFKLRFGL